MKRKNNIQNNVVVFVTILAFAITLAGFIVSYMMKDKTVSTELILSITATTVGVAVIPLLWTYSLLILKRVNPKKYVFFSYSKTEAELANEIKRNLETLLNENSKYRYEILIGDDIPLGIDMNAGIKELIEKSEIVILLVSDDYLSSKWCISEFKCFDFEKQKVIPIVHSHFEVLTKLPVDISNIKGLFLGTNYTSVDITELVKSLSKDLIKNQV